MMHCSLCPKKILVTQKRVQCTGTNCSRYFHQECVNFNEAASPRSKWLCPECTSVPPKGAALLESSTSLNTSSMSQQQDSILAELRSLRIEMNNKFEKQQLHLETYNTTLTSIQHDINNVKVTFSKIREEMDGIITSMKFLSDSHDDQIKINEENKTTMSKLIKENSALHAQLSEVTSALALMDQKTRDCNLEIQCVPEYKNENILTVVKQLAKTVSFELQEGDIKDFHRVAKLNTESKRPRNIVVKLGSPHIRDNFIAASKIYNKKHEKEKLNTSHLGIAGDKNPIYVVEHLSVLNKKLHAAARITAKDKKYEFVWIKNGRIFMRKDIKSPVKLIKDLNCLDSL